MEEKRKVAELLFEDERAIHKLANLKKSNSAPQYEGGKLLERAKKTVKTRAARYANAVKGLVDESR